MAKQAKRPAQSLAGVRRRAEEEALALGLELIDVAIVRENTGSVLRFTIDKDTSVTLDDCESFHRRVLKYAQDIDYDYMEVTSPGADRPLKTERDFERALGQGVEIHFYRQRDGRKQLTGMLTAFDGDSITVDTGAGEECIARGDVALIRMTLDEEELASPLFDELERADEAQEATKTQDGGESGT